MGNKERKIGIALSGGSQYGFAHIGVLKVLEENNIKIDIVAGTSMGAIIGGFYAAGMSLKRMEEILVNFSNNKIVDFNLFGLTSGGLLYGKKVTKLFEKYMGERKIEDCNKKFCCVASDLVTGKEFVFEEGSLVEAMRASMSVPGIFKPVKKDKMLLVDGGASENLPVSQVRRLGADIVIAVDVSSFYKKNNLKSAIDMVISATNLTVSNFVASQQDKGDIYIKIDQPNVSFMNFSHKDVVAAIKNGEKMAKKMLPEILNKLK